ncbi:MAG: amino acid ABC transporter permease [Janthinobacterium lividum]
MALSIDFSDLLQGENLHAIGSGIAVTLELTLLAWLLAMVLGTLLAVVRMTENRWAEALVGAYVEYHRNVPMLVQIFIWYFGVPTLLPDALQRTLNNHGSEFIFSCIAIGLCVAAYVSEDLRGGIRAIPASQSEAGRVLGLSYLQTSRLVVMPQAARIALPMLVNHTVLLFKGTSLGMTVGVAELMYATREIESRTFRTFEIYGVATLVYLGISILIMVAGELLERRYQLRAR